MKDCFQVALKKFQIYKIKAEPNNAYYSMKNLAFFKAVQLKTVGLARHSTVPFESEFLEIITCQSSILMCMSPISSVFPLISPFLFTTNFTLTLLHRA